MPADQPPPPTKTDAELRFDESRRKVGIVAGPLVFLLVLAWPFASLTPEAHRRAAVMGLVIVFWVTEALPLPVTALLGPALAVVLLNTLLAGADGRAADGPHGAARGDGARRPGGLVLLQLHDPEG